MAFSFNDKLENEGGGTLIVDSLNLAFRWKHRGDTDFRYKYQQTVQSLAKSYNCDRIIITADLGASSFRRDIDEEYKQNRAEKIAKQTEKEKMDFEEFISEYEETLSLLQSDYRILRFRGVEADDIAAHLVKHRDTYDLGTIWLVSSDRDWDLLIQEGVSRFSYVTRKETTIDTWKDQYDVPQEEYISLKCLTGDSGDNVAGIPGIGPKRASSLIRDYGSAFEIYDAIPINSKYKYIQSLNENAERILVNYQLMDLITYCDDAIGADNVSAIQEIMGVAA